MSDNLDYYIVNILAGEGLEKVLDVLFSIFVDAVGRPDAVCAAVGRFERV